VLDLQQYPRPWIGRRKTAVGGLLFGIGLAFTGSIAILNYFIKPTISATDFDNSVLASHDLTRIQKLIGRMTIEEKVGQLNIINMQGLTQNIGSNEDQLLNLVDDADNITLSETIKQVRGGQIGAMFNSRAGAGLYAVLQKVAVEESRLGIPLLLPVMSFMEHALFFQFLLQKLPALNLSSQDAHHVPLQRTPRNLVCIGRLRRMWTQPVISVWDG